MYLYDCLNSDYEKMSIVETNRLNNKTIFITGSNGLIGSNVLSYLYYLMTKKNMSLKIIAHSFSKPTLWLPKDKHIRYLSGDLRELDIDFSFDYLIHAATYAQPKKVFLNQNATIDLNIGTYIRLLEVAKRCKAKVLFFSTSSIYGNIPKEQIPAKETYNGNVDCTQVSSLYGESKRMAEIISQMYMQNGMDIKIIRLAIGYGPGAKIDDQRFINEFIKKAILTKEIQMMDRGEATRQVGFIIDVIEMTMNILLSGKGNIYNVSGEYKEGYGAKIRDVAEIIAKLTNAKVIYPQVNNGVKGAYNSVVIDITKYKQEFNKNHFIGLEEGLQKTIKWFEKLIAKGQE